MTVIADMNVPPSKNMSAEEVRGWEALHRESLRRQVALMEEVRDRMALESPDAFDAWMLALIPLTDQLLRALQESEYGAVGRDVPDPKGWWNDSQDAA